MNLCSYKLPTATLIAILASGCIAGAVDSDDDVSPDSEQAENRDDAVCAGNYAVTVYEHADITKGAHISLCPGNYPDLRKFPLSWSDTWNDRITGIYTSKQVYAYAYEHINYGGAHKYIGSWAFANLGETVWNDRISSIVVLHH